MINLKIDPEFQSQIPPLTDDTPASGVWLRCTAVAAGLSARPVAYTRFSGRRGRAAFESPALLELSPLLHRESRFLHAYVGTAFCQQPADTPATVGAVPYRW